jgi:integrase
MYNTNFHAYNEKYTYEKVIERQRKAKVITSDDAKLILQYLKEKMAKGQIQDRRAQRVATLLTQWRRFIKTPYNELTIDAILSGIMDMKKGKNAYGKPYKVNTQSSMIKAIKTFSVWLARKKIIIIDLMELDDIKPPSETTDSILPKDVLSDAQINAIIDACIYLRDKALISIIAETGARIGEAASLTWADMEFEDDVVNIRIIDGKDKSKWRMGYVALRKSYLVELRKMQSGDKETDFIFRTIDKGHHRPSDEPITYKAVCHMVERAAEKAKVPLPKGGITKIYRVSSVTNKLKTGINTAAIMKSTWGSGLNSKMFKHYEKLADVDTKRMIMQSVGIEEMPRPKLTDDNTIIKCICGERCAPRAKFCPNCGIAIDKKSARELKDAKNDIHNDPRYKEFEDKIKHMDELQTELEAKIAALNALLEQTKK